MPRYGVNTVDAPLQERVKSRKNYIVFISVVENPPKVDNLLSRATHPPLLNYRKLKAVVVARQYTILRLVSRQFTTRL